MQPVHHLKFPKLNRFCFGTVRFCHLQREVNYIHHLLQLFLAFC